MKGIDRVDMMFHATMLFIALLGSGIVCGLVVANSVDRLADKCGEVAP